MNLFKIIVATTTLMILFSGCATWDRFAEYHAKSIEEYKKAKNTKAQARAELHTEVYNSIYLADIHPTDRYQLATEIVSDRNTRYKYENYYWDAYVTESTLMTELNRYKQMKYKRYNNCRDRDCDKSYRKY